jgi:hypothetical protein
VAHRPSLSSLIGQSPVWHTDVLESAAVYEPLDPRAKLSLDTNAETFGGIQGLAPHADERRLEVCRAGEETAA